MSDEHLIYDRFNFFYVGHSLHVDPLGVEIYNVTVVRIVIEFCKKISLFDIHL